MAKKSMINKNERRRKAIELRKEKRKNFAILLLSDELDIESKFKLMKILDKTQGSSYIKYRNRCAITGRPRGYRGGVGLCRAALRHYASFGFITGVKKN